MSEPFEYNYILYNEAIAHLEQKWQRRLTPHECHILVEGYRYGRMVESENEIRILDTQRGS